MFLYSNSEINQQENLLSTVYPCIKKGLSTLPPLVQINTPYSLKIITARPQADSQQFFLLTLSPNSTTYITLSEQDVQLYLDNAMHHHNFYEFIFVLNGSICQKTEDKTIFHSKGDVCILNPFVKHELDFTSSKEFKIALLQISSDFLETLYKELSLKMFKTEQDLNESIVERFFNFNLYLNKNRAKCLLNLTPIFYPDETTNYVYQTINEIINKTLCPKFNTSHEIKNLLYDLFITFTSTYIYHVTPMAIANTSESIIFNKITDIMEQNHGRITRHSLEKQLHYSGSYLNKITKTYSGYTIYEYGMSFCMKEAARLLVKTNMSISEIATQLNFTNRTQFYNEFHNYYGTTPAAFRKKHQKIL